jgi:muramoyltetrapeptide carboxypeptidase LdcA involved in peptidoglycan recycling
VYPAAYRNGKRQLEETFGVQVVQSRYGIVSTIGGDDSIRMLPHLDYSVIGENPKVFLGYSDSTATHFAFLKAGVTSYYGPSVMAGFDENSGLPPYTAKSVRQVLFAPSPSLLIPPNDGGWTIESWHWGDEKRNEKKRKLQPCSGWKWLQGSGQHRGKLIGGCLEAVDWLRGTPVWPGPEVWRNSILFLETMDFGHTDPKFILPIGVEAEIDCDRQQFRLLESPVIPSS